MSLAPEPGTETRGLAALMFTDMVGFSALAQRDEALALSCLDAQGAIIRPIVARFGGREVKCTGDGYLIEFSSALAAAECAVEIQKEIARRNDPLPDDSRFHIRIGIHLGDVVRRDGDVFGDGVNIAARIEPLAGAGGICITNAVYDQIHNKLGCSLTQIPTPTLKNISVPVDVYRIHWDSSVAATKAWRKPRKRTPLVLAAACVLAVVAAMVVVPRIGRSPKVTGAPASFDRMSVAVLPFRNMSADKDNEFLSDGITEELLNVLVKVPGLRVPARTSAFYFKGKDIDVRKIGEMLQVGSILEGSVQKVGGKLKITAQLISTTDGYHLWSETYEKQLKDVFSIEDEIAGEIKQRLIVSLASSNVRTNPTPGPASPSVGNVKPAASPAKPPLNMDVWESYLRGRYHMYRYTEKDLATATTAFRKAIKIDPSYAKAHSALGFAMMVQAVFGYESPRDIDRAVRSEADTAIRLDPGLAEAHTLLAIKLGIELKPAEAEAEHKRALAIDDKSIDGHYQYAQYFVCHARLKEAVTELVRAHQLDPLNARILIDLGYTYTKLGQYKEALEMARQAEEIEPGSNEAIELRAEAQFRSGLRKQAIAAVEKVVAKDPGQLAVLANMYARVGRMRDAGNIVQQLVKLKSKVNLPGVWLAHAYQAIGENEKANEWMVKALDAREPGTYYIMSDAYEPWSRNPHYREWLAKLGIDKEWRPAN